MAIAQRRMTAELVRTLIDVEIARALSPSGDPDLHSVPLQTGSLAKEYRLCRSSRFSRLGCQRRLCGLFRRFGACGGGDECREKF